MTEVGPPPSAKISAVVSDVDGTLVTNEKVLTPRALAAVGELRAAGILFTIVSSRPPRGMRMLLEPLAIDRPIGSFNGGLIATPALTTISELLLPPQVARRAIDIIGAHDAAPWVFCGQDWLVRRADGPYIARERKTVDFEPTVVDDFEPFLGNIAKIVGASADFDRLAQCESEMQAALAGQATVARSQPYYLDVTHSRANKGEALSAIASLIGLPLSEIAVIGDGRNDVVMFERSGFSIAMGNASDEVKAKASAVTDSNEDEGFANAIQKFILRQVPRNVRKPGGA